MFLVIPDTELFLDPSSRKVAAEFQYNKVMAGIEELLKLKRHSHILDIVVFGCGDSGSFGLPPSYQAELGKCFQKLIDGGISCISTDDEHGDHPLLQLHMEDLPCIQPEDCHQVPTCCHLRPKQP